MLLAFLLQYYLLGLGLSQRVLSEVADVWKNIIERVISFSLVADEESETIKGGRETERHRGARVPFLFVLLLHRSVCTS